MPKRANAAGTTRKPKERKRVTVHMPLATSFPGNTLSNRNPLPFGSLLGRIAILLGLSLIVGAGSALWAQEAPLSVFQRFWKEAKANIYPAERVETHFTEAAYRELERQARAAADLPGLTGILNPFLEKLQVSHTRFYDNQSIDFYLFRSMFTTRALEAPKVSHLGAQLLESNQGWIVREVLEGYPAQMAGIRRGDVLLTAGGKPFHPYRAFNPKQGEVVLEILRNGKPWRCPLSAIEECPNQSYYQAMLNSQKMLKVEDRQIGYIHLWAGTHPQNREALSRIVGQDFKNCDGMILDLRGGFGGAWYEYLDPFFPNRSDYFQSTTIDREGRKKENRAEPKNNPSHFAGPLVVLINEGVRSGKESLAFQFRKSKRATLVGTRTAGAFTAGKAIFTDPKLDYFLLLATAEMLLDGQKVEGVGIEPNLEVPYPLERSLEADPQLEGGRQEILRLTHAWGNP